MNKKGFTLIELLVVIAVLGILAAVVLVAINPAERLRAARDAGAKSDIGQIATALEAYFTDNNGTYPSTAQTLTILATDNYLKQVPAIPAGSGSLDATYQYAPYEADGTTCGGAVTCTEATVWYDLEVTSAAPTDWCYQSATGTAGEILASAGTCAPGAP